MASLPSLLGKIITEKAAPIAERLIGKGISKAEPAAGKALRAAEQAAEEFFGLGQKGLRAAEIAAPPVEPMPPRGPESIGDIMKRMFGRGAGEGSVPPTPPKLPISSPDEFPIDPNKVGEMQVPEHIENAIRAAASWGEPVPRDWKSAHAVSRVVKRNWDVSKGPIPEEDIIQSEIAGRGFRADKDKLGKEDLFYYFLGKMPERVKPTTAAQSELSAQQRIAEADKFAKQVMEDLRSGKRSYHIKDLFGVAPAPTFEEDENGKKRISGVVPIPIPLLRANIEKELVPLNNRFMEALRNLMVRENPQVQNLSTEAVAATVRRAYGRGQLTMDELERLVASVVPKGKDIKNLSMDIMDHVSGVKNINMAPTGSFMQSYVEEAPKAVRSVVPYADLSLSSRRQADKVIRLRAAGNTFQEIADELKLTVPRVNQIYNDYSPYKDIINTPAQKLARTVRRMYSEGKTPSAIAKELNLTPARIYQIIGKE